MGSRTKRAGLLSRWLSKADAKAVVNAGLEEQCESIETCPRSSCRCTAAQSAQCPFYKSGEDTDDE